MKFNMEIMHVPSSSIYQKIDMMNDWKDTSYKAKVCSYISAGVSLAMVMFLLASGDEYFYSYIPGVLLFYIGGYLCGKWKYIGYIASLLGFSGNVIRFVFPLPESIGVAGAILVAVIFGFPVMFYALRCVCSYYTVFKELEKCAGFPDFIVNTADVFADKIYLKDKDENIYDNKFEAAYNPFNTQEDIKNEELRRNQDLKYSPREEKIHMDIPDDRDPEEILKKREPVELESTTIFGRYIIFPHADFLKCSFEEKKNFMGYWNMNLEFTTSNFIMFAFFVLMAGMISGFGTLSIISFVAIILVLVLGTNYLKMGNLIGVPIVVAGICLSFALTNSAFGLLFLIAAYLVNPGLILGTIRFVLNYKYYKELSTMEGFPSFIRTSADLYADKIYIVEKREVVKRRDPSEKVIRVMDIGYDNEPPEEDKAWNAFDYMDEEKESENDEG